jgi:DNA gyrase subunit A
MRAVITQELASVKETYGDRRRTQIVEMEVGASTASVMTASDLTPDKNVWIAINSKGLISRSLEDKAPRPSGRDAPKWLLRARTRDTLYLVNQNGKAAALAVHSLPEAEKLSDGVRVTQISALKTKTDLAAVFALPPKERRAPGWFVLTATTGGTVKKSPIEELPGPIAQTFRLAKVKPGDALGWARLTDGKSELLIATASGMAIRFSEEEVRPTGLSSAGVSGVKLKAGDKVVGLEIANPKHKAFLLLSNGVAKRVEIADFPLQGRYGHGVIACKSPSGAQVVGLANHKPTTRVSLHLDKLAPKSIRLDDAPVRGRAANGKSVVDVREGEQVISLTVPWQAPGEVVKKTKAKKKSPTKSSGNTSVKKTAKKKIAPKSKKGAPKSKPIKKTAAKKKPAAKKKGGSSKKPSQGKLDLK